MLWWLLGCGGPACPPEMARIGEGEGAFCIDRWEGQLIDEFGGAMATAPGRPMPGATTRSSAGVLPTIGISFDEAKAACAATAATVGGVTYARKHLATEAEWIDGADGTLGPGGRRWPWGEQPDPRRCVTVSAGAKGLAPTGSAPGCVSPEGVFDQVGNAFEWCDPDLRVDLSAALATFAAAGFVLRAGPDGVLLLERHDRLQRLNSFATAIQPGSLRRDEAGQLWMSWNGSLASPRGFLLLDDGRLPTTMLPVAFETAAGRPEARLRLWTEGDGTAITEKIGGAWYAGEAWPDGERAHTHDFRGSIGFRCAAPPR